MNFSIDDFLNTLTEEFSGFSFDFQVAEFTGKIPICFIDVDCDESILSDKWVEIVNKVAVDYQSQVEDEFAIWNLYLFFIVKSSVSDSLKYQIENDTFSSRKIVVEEDLAHETIVERYIKNSDLNLSDLEDLNSEVQFQPEPIFWEFLEDQQANKRLVKDDRVVFKKIVERIRNQANEDIES